MNINHPDLFCLFIYLFFLNFLSLPSVSHFVCFEVKEDFVRLTETRGIRLSEWGGEAARGVMLHGCTCTGLLLAESKQSYGDCIIIIVNIF